MNAERIKAIKQITKDTHCDEARMAVDDLLAELEKRKRIIKTCGRKFREYERIHALKVNNNFNQTCELDYFQKKHRAEIMEKVESNRKLAEMCERAIK